MHAVKLSAVFAFLLGGTLTAAEPTPREQVLKLVPPQASVCFVVQNLRSQAQTVAGSEFAQWAATKLGNKLDDNDDTKRLKQIEAFFLPLLGVSLTELRDDIFGDCLAFAYEPGPPGQPNAERGVMLLYARDPAKLQKLIAKLNDFQKASDELKELKQHTHAGRTYIERVRGTGTSEYYWVHEHIFAFALHSESITAIIDRQTKPPVSTVLKDLDDLKLQNAFWACWLNPRKLDAEMKVGVPNTPEAAGLAQMAKLWSAVDQCAFYLSAGEDLELGVSVTYRVEALPKEVRSQFATAPVASPFWNSIPTNAILAIAGDVEATALLDLIGSFLPAGERPKLHKQIEKELGAVVGRDKVPAILAALGPDFALWAIKSGSDGGPLPVVTAAMRVKNQPDASVAAAVLQTIGFYVQLFAFDYNRSHADQMSIDTATVGGLDVRTITNPKFFPQGVAPAFAMKDGFVVFGSNVDALTKFQAPTLAPSTGDVPLVRISGQSLRNHITTHRDGLAKLIASINDQDENAIRKDLDTLGMILEASDRAELLLRGDGRSRTLAVKLKLIKPLK